MIVRMKSLGRPLASSYALKASNGLVRTTPPKSKNAARKVTAREPTRKLALFIGVDLLHHHPVRLATLFDLQTG